VKRPLVPWEQTSSASFRARHDTADGADARRVLQSLEHVRIQLGEVFGRLPAQTTVVLHSHPLAVGLSNPLFVAARAAAAPSARPYVAGWVGHEELHVLSPAALKARTPSVPGSAEMLRLAAAALYARRVIAENNPDLVRVASLVRAGRELRWAWLLEGSARWFAGQTAHARPAVVRRLRDGRRPSFTPGFRDAPLLGGTVLDLLAAERGEQAVARFAVRLPSGGAKRALEHAFDRRLVSADGDWRSYLSRLAGGRE
jgi:hypothetical protein